jgi:spore maturation protein CgeB
LGAKACFPIYNALDPDTHYPVQPDRELSCDLAFVGNRLPDREARVEEFFLAAATQAPEFSFVLGGEGWGGKPLPSNVRWIGHVGSDRHNGVNCSARMVLNINRDSRARVGFSPPTRVFEAAGAASCLITDYWNGIESFFCPGTEILPARSAAEVVAYLRRFGRTEAKQIGGAMRDRAIREHTYAQRAVQLDSILRKAFRGNTSNKLDAASASIYSPA